MTNGRVPSLEELSDDFRDLREEIRRGFAELRAQREADAEQYVRKDVYEAQRAHDTERITRIEERLTWAVRAAVAGPVFFLVTQLAERALTSGGTP